MRNQEPTSMQKLGHGLTQLNKLLVARNDIEGIEEIIANILLCNKAYLELCANEN